MIAAKLGAHALITLGASIIVWMITNLDTDQMIIIWATFTVAALTADLLLLTTPRGPLGADPSLQICSTCSRRLTTMTRVILTLCLTSLLAGCLSDPAGMSTRTEIRARAYTEAARLEADARRYEASQETIRTGIMVAVVPWVALIVMSGIVIAIVVWWQGKIWHTRTILHTPHTMPQLPHRRTPGLADLMLLAERQGYRLEIEGRTAFLVDATGRRAGAANVTGEKNMTPSELEKHLTIIRAFIKNERRMRQRVFVNQPDKLAEKMTEIDNAIKSITEIVNALKATMPQQTKLIDAPPRQDGY